MATEVIIPMERRQGTFQSGSRTVDGVLAKPVRLQLDVHPADYEDPTLSVRGRLFRSADLGATWESVGGFRWVGGPQVDEKTGAVNPAPQLQVDLSPYLDQLVRSEIDIPVAMRVGASLVT